jgi:predicted nucleic acid-binding protein
MTVPRGLVFDTSVWINLLATEQPWTILSALNTHCVTPDEVVREVKRDPVTQRSYPQDKHPLRQQPSVDVVQLEGQELELFFSLVGQDSEDALGDGEAAAIALARLRHYAVALDDGKARRIVRERYPETSILMTVDILRDRSVVALLGVEGSKAAFHKAKQFGRMHVPKSN